MANSSALRRLAAFCKPVLILVACSFPSAARGAFSIRDLGMSNHSSTPGAVNDLGQAVFWTRPNNNDAIDSTESIVYYDGVANTTLPTLGGRSNFAIDININGVAVEGEKGDILLFSKSRMSPFVLLARDNRVLH